MHTANRSRAGKRVCFPLLAVTLGVAACSSAGKGGIPDRGVELYAIDFEAPAFAPGLLAGQDEWIAAFGSDAGRLITGDVRAARVGSTSLQLDGALVREVAEGVAHLAASFARPLEYAPVQNRTPRVSIEAWIGLTGDDGPTCGNALGLTGNLRGTPIANGLIGIQERDGAYVAYLSNWDGEAVYGPTYTPGDWLHVRSVYDFEARTIEAFANGVSFGRIPFTEGMGDEVMYINLSLGSPEPIPGIRSYFDGIVVTAGQ